MSLRPLHAKHALAVCVILLACVLAYWNSWKGQFVSDDVVQVARNQALRPLDWPHLQHLLVTFDGVDYMPITLTSYAADYAIWGPSPAGFHFTNLVFHGVAAVLVYVVLMQLGFPAGAALVAALLWATHPVQVESVAWISERKNVLSSAFFLCAFSLYCVFVDKPRIVTYFAVLALFTFSTLSKMNTVVLPAICVAYVGAFRFQLRRRDVLHTVPMLAIAVAVCWYNLAGNPIHGGDYHGGSARIRLLSSAVVVLRYLGNILVPSRLSAFYDVPLHASPWAPPVFFSLIAIVLAGLAVAVCLFAKHRAGFWILWFFITLAPMLNIVPFANLMADRYLYLPLLAPVALAVSGVLAVRNDWNRAAGMALLVVMVLTCIVMSARRVPVWATPTTLWEDSVSHTYYLAADPLFVQPGFDAKVVWLRNRIAESPSSGVDYNNLGAIYYESDRLADAIAALEAARRLDGDRPNILMNLGRAYARVGREHEAVQCLRKAAEAAPHEFVAHLYLLRAYLASGDEISARHELAECARIRPRDAQSPWFCRYERESLARLAATPPRSSPHAGGGGEPQ
jgi:hypothetical protein